MLKALLKGTELNQLLDVVSPAFWQVVPTRAVWGIGKQLIANHGDREGFAQAAERLRESLDPGIMVGASTAESKLSLADCPPAHRQEVGERILRLYFSQLMHYETTLLDLRPERFTVIVDGDSARLVWNPKAYWLSWPAKFLGSLRDMYRGFYRDDEALFHQALEQLGLTSAKQAFVSHFGSKQDAVMFETKYLIDSLHQSFVCCRDAKQTLDGEFLALGFYLTSMYQSLEQLGAPIDVRTLFSELEGQDNIIAPATAAAQPAVLRER